MDPGWGVVSVLALGHPLGEQPRARWPEAAALRAGLLRPLDTPVPGPPASSLTGFLSEKSLRRGPRAVQGLLTEDAAASAQVWLRLVQPCV